MDTSPIQDDVIKVKILMLSQFYNIMLKPTGRNISSWNVYKLSLVVYSAVVLTLIAIGCLGYFVQREYFITNNDLFLNSFSSSHVFISIWKLVNVLNNSNLLWEMLDVTKLTFCTSNACSKNIRTLNKYRNKTLNITNFFVIFTSVVFIMWLLCPLTLIAFTSPDVTDFHKPNILNLPFPVRLETYNKYYALFYIIESVISMNVSSYMVFFDSLFIIICMSMIAQYKVINRAFRYIGYEKKPWNEDCEDFKSVIADHQKLESKLRLFYSAVKNIILVYVAFTFCSIIIITFIFVKRDSVNFAIYSCNWREMDLKFRKLLLLTMHLNNANQTVIITTYNIVSVMVKTIPTDNHQ